MSVKGPPKGQTIGLIAGSARTFRFQIEHDGSKDITGFGVWLNVGRTNVGNVQVGDVLLKKSSDVPGEVDIVNATLGLVDVNFVSADSLSEDDTEPPIPACGSAYKYDVWISVGGVPYSCLTPGDFIVTAGVGPGLLT